MPDDWSTATLRKAELRAVVETQARAAFQANKDFLALPAPAYPLNAAAQQALVGQVVALTRQNNDIMRLLLVNLSD